MDIVKGFKTEHSFERSELRTIFIMVEKDVESFTNVVAEMLANKQEELEKVRSELETLKQEKC